MKRIHSYDIFVSNLACHMRNLQCCVLSCTLEVKGHCYSVFVCQDPLKASDKPLSDCGPYILDEEDAMVYRRPYLTSGASGFALTTLSRNMKKQLKVIGAFQRLMCILLL